MTGIYKITNPEGEIYIGSSVNILRRWSEHIRRGSGTLSKLKMSLYKHGNTMHEFTIIELCDKSMLLKRERYWQDFYKVMGAESLNIYKADNTLYVGGKRQRKDRYTKNTFFLDTYTGIYYKTIREICDTYSIGINSLRASMHGYGGKKNKTRFIKT